MTALIEELCAELDAEQLALDGRLADLGAAGWTTATPAAGWDVRDQVSHLCFYDQAATVALTDPAAFGRHAAGARGPEDVELGRSMDGGELLERWRQARAAARAAALAAAQVAPKTRVPWYGPAMSLASFVTARLMETWAHGTDVADALGYPPVVSERLRHVCLIGIKARPYAFMIHERDDPGDPVRFDVTAPDGSRWAWGPADAADRVTGSALDLALLVTQRRHLSDTDLVVGGRSATAWMEITQAFAGPAGTGRQPRT